MRIWGVLLPLKLLISVKTWVAECYNKVMVCPIKGVSAGKNIAPPTTPKTPPKKRPLQISEELHALVSQLAADRKQSLEQIVAFAVLKQAKGAPLPSDSNHQILYRQLISQAEKEIKLRYHAELSRRSAHMRHLNMRRQKLSNR